jgi:predicted transcriptional regulator
MARKHPLEVRVWAILHFIEDARIKETPCKQFDLTIYLRSNWKATRELVDFAMSNGWIKRDEATRTFRITDEGRLYLVEIRKVLDPLRRSEIAGFLRGTGTPDQPK